MQTIFQCICQWVAMIYSIITSVLVLIYPSFEHHGLACCFCCCLVTRSCLTLSDPMNCSPPVSSVHGTFQAKILEQVAIIFSRGSSWPRDQTHISWVSCTAKRILHHWGNINILSSEHIFKMSTPSIHHNLNFDHIVLHRLIPNDGHVCFSISIRIWDAIAQSIFPFRSFQVPPRTSCWAQLQQSIPGLIKSFLISTCSSLSNPFSKLPLINFLQRKRK